MRKILAFVLTMAMTASLLVGCTGPIVVIENPTGNAETKENSEVAETTEVEEVTEDTITYEQGGVEHVITDADTLVFANGYHVDSSFEELLKEAGAHYHLIGDGEKVGNLKDAITRAYEVVKNI